MNNKESTLVANLLLSCMNGCKIVGQYLCVSGASNQFSNAVSTRRKDINKKVEKLRDVQIKLGE